MTASLRPARLIATTLFTALIISLSLTAGAKAGKICKQPTGEYGMYYYKKAKAKSSAIGRWEKKVAIKHGIGLSFWNNAKVRSNICKKQANNTYRCFAIGTPCQIKTSCKPVLKKHGMYYFNKQKAKDSAKGRWEKQAAINHGVKYSFWNSAKKKHYKCKKQDNNTWRCLAIARPCN
ncbi:MAG: hypothetical protein DHS20C08_19160 [Rhodomicrobium sp.]|nr:MAG: hypothetical protein DHS20C08_19160 [Rhodomicrobium sp.]